VKGPVQAMSDSLSGDQKQEGNQPVMTTTHLCIDPRPEQVFSDIAEACDNKKQEGNQSTSPTVSSQLDPGSMSVIGDGLLEGKLCPLNRLVIYSSYCRKRGRKPMQ
jgi:hypothetical protein